MSPMCARRIAVVTESQRREREASPWTVLPRIAKRPPVLDPRPTSQTKPTPVWGRAWAAARAPQLAARIRTTPQRRLVTAEALRQHARASKVLCKGWAEGSGSAQ